MSLTPALRAVLAELADALIPGGEGMPSAREAGVAAELVDRVLAVWPLAAPGLFELLDRLAGEPAASGVVRARVLRADDPAAFGLLASFVVGAYFLDPGVRAAIGYPGQGPSEVTFEDETGYIADGLLDPVLERGPRAPAA